MRNKSWCETCNGPLADWERELHDGWHEVHAPKPEPLGFWKTISWGILFALPFIVMCLLIGVIYK